MTIHTADAAQNVNLTYALFRETFPWAMRNEKTARKILSHPGNTVFLAKQDESVAGAAVLRGNTVLLMAVRESDRGKGIGSTLLSACERAAKAAGHRDLSVGAGDDYLTPGVPCRSKPYPETLLTEAIHPEIDDSARAFFEKRGYFHSWNGCNCFDMFAPFPPETPISERVGDTVQEIVYRWAVPEDREEILRVTDAVEKGFTKYYDDPALYDRSSDTDVLAAFFENVPVGVIMVSRGTESPDTGSVGCTAVHPDFQGKGIATCMVRMGTRYLAEKGFRKGFLGYTYSGLDRMYGRAGYRICTYYFMAKKVL